MSNPKCFFCLKYNRFPKNKNLYIGGENYSQRQAWMEGALETTDKISNLFK